MILCDPSSERAVLSAILKYGEDAFGDKRNDEYLIANYGLVRYQLFEEALYGI